MKHIETHSRMTLFFIWCGMGAQRLILISSPSIQVITVGIDSFLPSHANTLTVPEVRRAEKNIPLQHSHPLKQHYTLHVKSVGLSAKKEHKIFQTIGTARMQIGVYCNARTVSNVILSFFLLCGCFLPTTFKPAQTRSEVKKGNMVDNFWFTYVGTIISVSEESRKSRSRTLGEARVGCMDETFWVWFSREIQSQGISLYSTSQNPTYLLRVEGRWH